ncbi:hypothetical protein ACWDY4_25795 [Streptomyces olivaceoviridis]
MVEQTRHTLKAAVAMLHDGARERVADRSPQPQPAPATAPLPHTQQPGTQHTRGRTTGGIA